MHRTDLLHRSHPESGHILATLMVGLMVMVILLGAAFQQWSVVMQREREKELIFRGNQYVLAILTYRMEHGGALPLELEELERPGPRGLRYIRRLYSDPFDRGRGTEEGEEGWGLLYLGPGGRWIIDPQAAERAADRFGRGDIDDIQNTPFANAGMTPITAGMSGQAGLASNQSVGILRPGGAPGGVLGAPLPGQMPGQRPGQLPAQLQGGPGATPGAVPGITGGPSRRDQMFAGGNFIVGVVSRNGTKSFSRYTQRDYYWDWQFHIFKLIRRFPIGMRPAQTVPLGGGLGPGGNLFAPGENPDQQGSRGPGAYDTNFGTRNEDRPRGGSQRQNQKRR